MSGADNSNDDMVVGRVNNSEERTILLAGNGDNAPDGYEADFVLFVGINGEGLPIAAANGIDGVSASGSLGTGGGATPLSGNGIIGRGLNGGVGYVHAAVRDKDLESSVGAGLLGVGGAAAPGVFGKGQNGVVGYEQSIAARDTVFEAGEMAGVLGVGQTGVSGRGQNGAGVHGTGMPGVQGDSQLGPGVLGQGQTGLFGIGQDGAGVQAQSKTEQAAVLQSGRVAQLWLVPLRIKDPFSIPRSSAGELVATIWRDPQISDSRDVASLWFCTVSGGAGAANWLKVV